MFQIKFFRIILDEAHNIKNRKSLQAKAATSVDAECRWAVTGTPIHNHIDDLFSLFHFLRVNPHGDWRWWSKNIAKPFEKKKPEAVEALQTVMKELLIRRTKNKKVNGEKIIKLPEKSVRLMKLEFGEAERILYRELYEYAKGKFNEFVKNGTVMKNYANILGIFI
jgi:SNF2 family DNA or RNA helicase